MKKAARKKQSFFELENDEKVKKIDVVEETKEKKPVQQAQKKEDEPSLVERLEEIESNVTPKRFKIGVKSSKKLIYVLFFVVLGVTIGVSIFFYMKYDQARKASQTGNDIQTVKETQKLLDKVGKLIQLPTGETPTVATVTDQEKLADQPFFRSAKNGDRVIIYGSTQMAYLYRPSVNMLINVAPINVNPEQAPAEPRPSGGATDSTSPTPSVAVSVTPSVAPSPTKGEEIEIVILNGTTKVGLTKTAEVNIKAKNSAITVVDRDNAKSSDYDTTIVIDAGGGKVKAETIAKLVGGKVVALPSGETKPSGADVLVILGTDYK